MNKVITTLLIMITPLLSLCQTERWNTEMAVNISNYNSLSISIEKEFTYNKFKFGPRVELINLFNNQSYQADDTLYQMNAQLRIRLAQIEYQLNDKIRLGIAPFWMLGPIPRKGFYKTPTSFYTHIQIKESLSLETSLTSSNKELFQISIRKEI